MKFERTFMVGKFKCEMTFEVEGTRLNSEWSPEVPRKLTKKMIEQYREGRNALMAEVASKTGKSVMLVEV